MLQSRRREPKAVTPACTHIRMPGSRSQASQGGDSQIVEIELIGTNHQTFTRKEEETEKKDDIIAVRMKQPTPCLPPKTREEEGKREDETEKNEM